MQDHILALQAKVATCEEKIAELKQQQTMLNAEIRAAKAELKNAFVPFWEWNVEWKNDAEFRVSRKLVDYQVEEAKMAGFDDRLLDWHGMTYVVLIDGSLYSNGGGNVILKDPANPSRFFEKRIKLEAFELDMFKKGLVPERLRA